MSTKIYNAYRTVLPIHDLIEFFHKKRQAVYIDAVKTIVENLDMVIKNEKWNKSKKIDKYDLIINIKELLEKEFCSEFHSMYNFNFNNICSIYFPTPEMRKYRKNIFFILFINNFSPNQKTIFNFEKEEYIFDFHFQDQTDPPIDVKYSDYLNRKKVWNILLDDCIKKPNARYYNGLQYEFLSILDCYSLAYVAAHIYQNKIDEKEIKTYIKRMSLI